VIFLSKKKYFLTRTPLIKWGSFLNSKKMKIQKKMIDALALKYESEIADAEATLLIYFSNPVGIGEHPQHLEEMDKFVEKMANAKDKLETLKEFVKYNLNDGN
jgi:hypothetical protein